MNNKINTQTNSQKANIEPQKMAASNAISSIILSPFGLFLAIVFSNEINYSRSINSMGAVGLILFNFILSIPLCIWGTVLGIKGIANSNKEDKLYTLISVLGTIIGIAGIVICFKSIL